jgi:hypothetical protein
MNDNISPEKTPRMTDAQLDGLLDALETPPAPSDLLRARLANAAAKGRPAAPVQASRGGWFFRHQALCGRIAASLCLAAVVGMAAWLPAPAPAPSGKGPVVRVAEAPLPPVLPASEAWDSADLPSAFETADAGPALSLVGDGGAAISGIGLVQASWSGAGAADLDESGELDDIPLD